MGEVVFWTLIRIVIILPIVWLLKDRVDYNFWWTASLISIYLLIIHPALVKIKSFNEKNKDIIEGTLCATCEYFNESAVLCLKHDEHPTKEYIPCDGIDWSPAKDNKNY